MKVKVKVRRKSPPVSPDKIAEMERLLRTPKWQRAMELVQLWDKDPTMTPSPHGRDCLSNGSWPGYPCRCPDCDWYATICFPDYAGDAEDY